MPSPSAGKSASTAFLACWTRKEAYVKARGFGLSAPLDRFSVSVAPDCAAVRLETADGQEARDWSIDALDAGVEFMAAVCVQGTRARIVPRAWSGPPWPVRASTSGNTGIQDGETSLDARRHPRGAAVVQGE
jgi:hypothetical protein